VAVAANWGELTVVADVIVELTESAPALVIDPTMAEPYENRSFPPVPSHLRDVSFVAALDDSVVPRPKYPVPTELRDADKTPPTFKPFAIATPPSTIIEPVVRLDVSVVPLIVTWFARFAADPICNPPLNSLIFTNPVSSTSMDGIPDTSLTANILPDKESVMDNSCPAAPSNDNDPVEVVLNVMSVELPVP
jgi:hypothetical protein